MEKPSIKLVCDRRSASKRHGGKHPVKLVVTFRVSANKWKQVYYGTKYYMLPKEFDRVMKNPSTVEDKLLRASLQKYQDKAFNIIQTKKDLTPDSFDRYFMGNRISSIEGYFDLSIAKMKAEGRVGATRADAIKSFKKFDPNLSYFSDVTVEWINRYSRWMREPRTERGKYIKPKSITTVAMYLTELRTVFNEAIEDGTVERDLYPFTKFTIQREVKFKVPLTPEEIQKVKDFQTDNPNHRMAVDWWLIVYYCFGTNIADLLSLRFSDMTKDFLIYDRQKTRGTKSQVKVVEIYLRPELRELIDKYKRPSLNPQDYIFQVREVGMSVEEFTNRRKEFIRKIDHALKRVAKKLGIEKLNTNIARHTASNVLMNEGYDDSLIGLLLGHTNSRTTYIYKGLFRKDALKKASGSL